jgi:hypothetical protein
MDPGDTFSAHAILGRPLIAFAPTFVVGGVEGRLASANVGIADTQGAVIRTAQDHSPFLKSQPTPRPPTVREPFTEPDIRTSSSSIAGIMSPWLRGLGRRLALSRTGFCAGLNGVTAL